MPTNDHIPTVEPPKPDPRVLLAKPHPREVRGDTNADEWATFEQSAVAFLNELASEMKRYRLAIITGAAVGFTALCSGPVFLCGVKTAEMISAMTSSGHTSHFTQPEEHIVQVVGARSSMQLTDSGLSQGQFICDKESSHVRSTSCQGGFAVSVDYRCEVEPTVTNVYRTVSYRWDPNCSPSTQ